MPTVNTATQESYQKLGTITTTSFEYKVTYEYYNSSKHIDKIINSISITTVMTYKQYDDKRVLNKSKH